MSPASARPRLRVPPRDRERRRTARVVAEQLVGGEPIWRRERLREDRKPVSVGRRRWVTQYSCGSRIWLRRPRQRPDQRRLSGSVRSDQPEDFTAFDRHGNARQGDRLAVGFPKLTRLDDGFHARRYPSGAGKGFDSRWNTPGCDSRCVLAVAGSTVTDGFVVGVSHGRTGIHALERARTDGARRIRPPRGSASISSRSRITSTLDLGAGRVAVRLVDSRRDRGGDRRDRGRRRRHLSDDAHPPVNVAHAVATVAEMFDGRFTFGVGTGEI